MENSFVLGSPDRIIDLLSLPHLEELLGILPWRPLILCSFHAQAQKKISSLLLKIPRAQLLLLSAVTLSAVRGVSAILASYPTRAFVVAPAFPQLRGGSGHAWDLSSPAHTMSAKKQIGTHDGAFHCDEALACWMLHQTLDFRDASITRTRVPEKLAEMDIVVDVGAVYDESRLRFDHHQRDFTTTFDHAHTVTKLSSAGLVYKHFGKEVLRSIVDKKKEEAVSEEELERLYQLVYDNFIEEIDAIDNGVSCYGAEVEARYKVSTMLGSRVGRLNPAWNDPHSHPDDQFRKAMAITGAEMESIVASYAFSFLPARSLVVSAVEARHSVHDSGQIIVLSTACPWKEHLQDLEASSDAHIIYVLYPDQGGSWRIQAVPKTPSSFESRKPLPEPWRGVRDKPLSDLTGVEGCIFVHASGFIGGTQTKEAAITLANLALKHA